MQDTVDETMSDTIHMTTIYLMILLTSLAIVTVSIYYYAALTAALFLAFFLMQHIYLPAATLLKRWAGETANNVFVHVDESLHGIDVIRAFDAVNYFIQVRAFAGAGRRWEVAVAFAWVRRPACRCPHMLVPACALHSLPLFLGHQYRFLHTAVHDEAPAKRMLHGMPDAPTLWPRPFRRTCTA